MFGLGPWELGIILLIVIVIFGAGRLPEIGSALGKSIRGFKEEVGTAAEGEEADGKEKPAATAKVVTSTKPLATVETKDEAPAVSRDEAIR
jgi:sec-independent protein translocase protein TatA